MSHLLHISLLENQKEHLSRSAIEMAADMPIEAATTALHPLVALETYGSEVLLRAGRSVGSMRIGRLRLDVQPRMAASELATLIRLVWGKGRITHRTDPLPGRCGLDELVARMLAQEAETIWQRGLARRYERRHEKLDVLRGRPDFLGSFPWNERGMSTIACTHFVLTADNPNNRLLRYALELASMLDVQRETRQKLSAHRAAYSAVASATHAAPQDFEQARARYDRLSDYYELAHRLGELLARGLTVGRLFETGPAPTSGMMISMPDLFEGFVEILVEQWAAASGKTVQVQTSDARALLDDHGQAYRRVRPDVIVYEDGRPILVLDAKYKDYWSATPEGLPERRVGTEDLYQLFFYAQRLQRKHDLPHPPQAIIVAPLPAVDERGGRGTISTRYRRIRWRAGHETEGDVRLVLVPLTETLRDLEIGHTGVLGEVAASLSDEVGLGPIGQR